MPSGKGRISAPVERNKSATNKSFQQQPSSRISLPKTPSRNSDLLDNFDPRDLEDTWKVEELEKSIKDAKKSRSSKDKDRDDRKKEKRREDDDDKKSRRKRDDDNDKKERRHKENGDVDKRKDKDRDKDKEKRRSKKEDEDEEERRRRKEKERRKRKEEEGDGKEKRRRHKEEDEVDGHERKERKHHGDDEDEERRRRKKEEKRREKDKEGDDDKEKRRRHREEDGEKEKRRKHRDEDDGERKHRKHRDGDDEEKERKERRSKDKDERRHHRDKDNEDEAEREKRHRERRERKEREKTQEDEEEREKRHRERKERKEREQREREEELEDLNMTEREDYRKKKLRRHRHRHRRHYNSVVEDTDSNEDEAEILQSRRKYRHHKKDKKDYYKESADDTKIKNDDELVTGYTEDDEGDDDVFYQFNIDDEVAGSELGSKHSSYYRTFVEETPKSHSERRKKQEKEKEEKKGDDDYNYDDEDFEDYDDDFEDEDNDNSDDDEDDEPEEDFRGKQSKSEVSDLMKAMDEENERLMSESRRSKNQDRYEDSDSDRTPNRDAPSRGRTFINFVSAKQRQVSNKAANKTKKRSNELQELIELDVAGYAMFDMPPVKEYDMYIKSFGRSNTRQAYIQTNDDNIEREIQTDEIETREKWCQHPPENFRGSGGGNQDEDDEEIVTKQNDTIRLGKFLEKAGQTIAILLEEDRNEKIQGEINRKESNIILSEAFVELSPVPFLRKRHVIYSAFSPVQTHLLLTVYSKPEKASKSDKLSMKGIICVWNVNEPFRPQKILVSESQPTCCCFSPTKATLAFAGMHDGSIVVWDLRESSSLHHSYDSGKEEWLLRYPTYNTAGVLQYDNHQSGITTVVPVASPGESSTGASEGDGGDTESGAEVSFQLATVEENSVLNLWVVAEIANPDLAGSESDLGLAPGGRVKLLKSSSIELENPTRHLRVKVSMTAYEMQLLPSDPSHFYIGTDTGCIIHGVRYGGKAPPKAFRPEIDTMVEVTSLDFSPFTEPVFLAGCGDGSLSLYHTQCENPLITWPSSTEGRSIKSVRWCRSRPSAFFVLDNESNLYTWDLNMSDAVPMKEEKVSNESIITSLSLSNDHTATGIGTPGRNPQMVVCLENGTVEVHTISKQFSALMPEEVDQFAAFINAIG